MAKARAPIDMLRLCRAEFAKQAENFDVAKRKAGTVWEANAAEEFGATAKRFVSDIDATLRDWA
jgi:hypothetical protein